MNNLTSYCICYGENHPKWNQTAFNQKNIMAGASQLSEEKKLALHSQNFILDDEGDNISDLNHSFADLTGVYWMWKNAPEEWLAISHYRRFWIEDRVAELDLNPKTIYMAQPQIWPSTQYNFNMPNEQIFHLKNEKYNCIWKHYVDAHGSYGVEKLFELSMREGSILKHDHVSMLNHAITMYPYNMFFAHRDLFNKVCEIHFDILLKIYDESKEYIKTLDDYQRRLIGFLGERLMTILFINKKYYFGDDIETRVVEMLWV